MGDVLRDAKFRESVSPAALEVLKTLAADAKTRAAEAITAHLGPNDDTLSLEVIDSLTAAYEQQRDEADSEIQRMLEEKEAALGSSAVNFERTHHIAGEIDSSVAAMKRVCEEAKTALAAFPRSELELASVGLSNLRSVLSLIDFYSSIPGRCSALRLELSQNPEANLKSVYIRAMELEIWHASIRREVSAAGNRARLKEAEQQQRGRRGSCDEAAELGAVSQVLGSHFAAVSTLVHEVFSVLHLNLGGRLLRLGDEAPSVLVATAEIVEMHFVLQRRLVREARSDAERLGEDPDEAEERHKAQIPAGIPAREDAFSRVYEGAKKHAMTEFTEAQMRLADEGATATASLIGASTRLILMVNSARLEAAPCVPPCWCLVRIMRLACEEHLTRQLSVLWEDSHRMAELEVAELLQVAEWLGYYNSIMAEVDIDEEHELEFKADAPASLLPCGPSAVFKRGADQLMSEYLGRIVTQVEQWFQAIRDRPAALRESHEGRPVTTRPEDMFQIVVSQVTIAREHEAAISGQTQQLNMAGQHVATVTLRCLEELRSDAERSRERVLACSDAVDVYMSKKPARYKTDPFVAPDLDKVVSSSSTSETQQLEVEVLCSIANDALRVQERCEALVDSLKEKNGRLEALEEGPALQSIEAVSADIICDYGELAVLACAAAAAAPFVDLKTTVFFTFTAERKKQHTKKRDDDNENDEEEEEEEEEETSNVATAHLFTEEWEAGETDGMSVALGTLDDYLADFKLWLPDLLFSKLLREALERLIRSYLDSLLRSTRPFEGADRVAQLLLRDQNALLEKFTTVGVAAAGLRDGAAVGARLGVLRALAEVASCTPPHVPDFALEQIYDDTGGKAQAAKVALKLLARHPDCARSQRTFTSTQSNVNATLAKIDAAKTPAKQDDTAADATNSAQKKKKKKKKKGVLRSSFTRTVTDSGTKLANRLVGR